MNPGDLVIDAHLCKMSDDGYRCLSSASVARIQFIAEKGGNKIAARSQGRKESLDRLKRVTFYKSAPHLDGYGPTLRYVVRVIKNETPYWVDIVTGTLYREDGSCLTSPFLRLHGDPVQCRRQEVAKFLKNKIKADKDDERV